MFRRIVVLAISLLALNGCTLFFDAPIEKFILYPVKKKDSIPTIAARFDISVNELLQLNRIRYPKNITEGVILKIPYRGQILVRTKDDIVLPSSQEHRAPDGESKKVVNVSGARKYIGNLGWPVPGSKLSSGFGKRWLSFHEGLDFAAPIGVPIYAAHDGQVVYSGDGLRGYGNLVIIKGDGILTVYAHNRTNVATVGDWVKKGRLIARLGNTGKSTGPHMHFETRIKNAQGKNIAVDPMVFYPKGR